MQVKYGMITSVVAFQYLISQNKQGGFIFHFFTEAIHYFRAFFTYIMLSLFKEVHSDDERD